MIHPKSFTGFIIETLQLDIDSDLELIEDIFGHCLRYICKCDKYTTFNKTMKSLLDFSQYDFSESDLRIMVRANGYALTSVKFYALAYAKGRNCPERAEDLYPQYDMYRCDAKIIKNLFERKGFKTSLLRDTEFDTHSSSISPEALGEAVNLFVHLLPAISKHSNICLKDLRFIVKSNNFQKDEFETEFITQALRSYYYLIPTKKTGLELENYIRSSMTKHKVNLIKSHTTQGRQRMVKAGTDEHGNDKFVMNLVSQSQLNTYSEDGDEVEFDGLLTQTSLEKAREDEFMLSVDRLILKNLQSNRRSLRRKAEILAIFTGRPNINFEKYLRDKNLLRSDAKTFSDFIDEKPREVYLEEVSSYMNISVKRLEKNLKSLGKQLALESCGDLHAG